MINDVYLSHIKEQYYTIIIFLGPKVPKTGAEETNIMKREKAKKHKCIFV